MGSQRPGHWSGDFRPPPGVRVELPLHPPPPALDRLDKAVAPRCSAPDFFGVGPRFEAQYKLITRVAARDATVLIRGETGTGKEVVASLIHRLSPRRDQPFVVVDCGAIQESLLQSELFGHEQGAFTGANRTSHGLFEVADGGTLFLDEVGEVSPMVQAGLLRVLESASFRRIGSTNETHVDIRLIAATNRDLEELIAAGRFRKDLYFRLNTVQIDLLPLRERADEIDALVHHLLAGENMRRDRQLRITEDAIQALRDYVWPGNIRQLRHVLDRATILVEGDCIDREALGPEFSRKPRTPLSDGTRNVPTLADVERQHIEYVLSICGNHRSMAARLLGISERNLYRRLRELNLK